jgi:hypothetical protein
MNAFQQALFELEKAHAQVRSAYEEDLQKLRHELESRGIPVPPETGRKLSQIPIRKPHVPSFNDTRPPQLPTNPNAAGLFGSIMGNASLPPQGIAIFELAVLKKGKC